MNKHSTIKILIWAACLYILSLCVSCSTASKCEKAFKVLEENGCLTSDTTRKDTTIYNITYKYTTILIQKDSAVTSVKNPCDEKGKLKPINKTYKSGRSTVNLKTDTAKNEIIATATCDELEIKLQQKETIIDRYREMTIKNSFHVEPSKWTKIKENLWWLLVALGIGFGIGFWFKR
jgi:hypothetical protein